ncbi:hypothetical protein BDV96DRAFT_649383 [Lophiotrema nucula]|uniref:Uncharacterized protein n=1 Tax=Lophiotrema nucula TaxID=690887 RepID=A0A6A5Z0U6_9PLEO|nr:hypothetical protein BDV96DRAFT_649383 [Lophiotrema nucula]
MADTATANHPPLSDMPQSDVSPIKEVPGELVSLIVEHLEEVSTITKRFQPSRRLALNSAMDICNVRLVSKKFYDASFKVIGKLLGDRTIRSVGNAPTTRDISEHGCNLKIEHFLKM